MDLVRPFGPVVENPSDKPRFLYDKPINIIRSGNYNHVPLMIGYSRKESMAEVLHKHRNDAEIVPNFDFIIPCDLDIEKGSEEWDALVKRLKEFYFGNEEDPKRIFNSYVDVCIAKIHFVTWHLAFVYNKRVSYIIMLWYKIRKN